MKFPHQKHNKDRKNSFTSNYPWAKHDQKINRNLKPQLLQVPIDTISLLKRQLSPTAAPNYIYYHFTSDINPWDTSYKPFYNFLFLYCLHANYIKEVIKQLLALLTI
jgi:hypothetical protein